MAGLNGMLAGLLHRRAPVEDLVEPAEREKHHQADAEQQRRVVVDQRHRPACSQMVASWRDHGGTARALES